MSRSAPRPPSWSTVRHAAETLDAGDPAGAADLLYRTLRLFNPFTARPDTRLLEAALVYGRANLVPADKTAAYEWACYAHRAARRLRSEPDGALRAIAAAGRFAVMAMWCGQPDDARAAITEALFPSGTDGQPMAAVEVDLLLAGSLYEHGDCAAAIELTESLWSTLRGHDEVNRILGFATAVHLIVMYSGCHRHGDADRVCTEFRPHYPPIDVPDRDLIFEVLRSSGDIRDQHASRFHSNHQCSTDHSNPFTYDDLVASCSDRPGEAPRGSG